MTELDVETLKRRVDEMVISQGRPGIKAAIIAALEDRDRLRAAAREAKEGLWELLKDPLVPHRLGIRPGMVGSRARQGWDRAVAAYDGLRAALEGRDGSIR